MTNQPSRAKADARREELLLTRGVQLELALQLPRPRQRERACVCGNSPYLEWWQCPGDYDGDTAYCG